MSFSIALAALLDAGLLGTNAPAATFDGGLSPAVARAASPIVNGLATQDFPAVALLVIRSSGGITTCSGTLVGCHTILTAAHCVCDGVPGSHCDPTFGATVSAHFQHYGELPVSAVVVHPQWNGSVAGGHDLALARLDAALPIRPLEINLRESPVAGDSGVIVGFGQTRGDRFDAGLKRAGAVELGECPPDSPPASSCRRFDEPVGAAGEDSSTCQGDSGGPLLVADGDGGSVVAGVTSFSDSPTCSPEHVAVYADVFADREWILAAAAGDIGSASCTELDEAGTTASPFLQRSGSLSAESSAEFWSFDVPPDTELLAVTLHGENTRFLPSGIDNDFELSVHPSDPSLASCRPAHWSSLESCRYEDPPAGEWTAGAEWYQGAGDYQLTITLYGSEQPEPVEPPCATDATHLCLQRERFRAGVEFLASGTSGSGRAAALTGDTGTFWFFDPANVEVVLKVLDGCTINDHFWVFAAGLTDVELVLTVDDALTGVTRRYFNVQGEPFRPVLDTTAFATCSTSP